MSANGMLGIVSSVVLTASITAGCAFVDDYSGRAVRYNLEAEQTQDQDILLNVARASKRRPLEFTGVQSISGTASASASTSLTFPFGRKQGPNSFSLNDSVSGGPTFSVSVLDTQEFFEGILKPIEMGPIGLYVEERYSRPLLFNLFFSSVTIKQKNESGDTITRELKNNVAKDDDLNQFQDFIDYLVNIGLTTRSRAKTSTFGPVLFPEEVTNLEHISKLASASLDIKEVKWCDLSDADRSVALRRLKQEGYLDDLNKKCKAYKAASDAGKKPDDPVIPSTLPAVLYRAQKSADSPRFCFERHMVRNPNGPEDIQDPSQQATKDDASGLTIDQTSAGCDPSPKPEPKEGARPNVKTTGTADQQTVPQPSVSGTEFLSLRLPPALDKIVNVRRNKGVASDKTPPKIDLSKPVTVTLQPRSTEGVIYYLGEVVRRALYPDYSDQNTRVVMIKYGPTDKSIPEGHCEELKNSTSDEYRCEAIFTVNDAHAKADAFVSVTYDGERYAIARDASKVGRTYQVMDLVTQLIALHKSAKDLPATSVFTIISPP